MWAAQVKRDVKDVELMEIHGLRPCLLVADKRSWQVNAAR
jgi:hypothetical protein